MKDQPPVKGDRQRPLDEWYEAGLQSRAGGPDGRSREEEEFQVEGKFSVGA